MEKINVAELLKDCPKGMELDCTMFDNVTLDSVDIDGLYPIKIATKNGYLTSLTEYGQNIHNKDAKCVIFPKGKTTWEGFVPPCKFKDGDIIFTHTGDYDWVSIFKHFNEKRCCTYIDLCIKDNKLMIDGCDLCYIGEINTQRIATEEEKQKLFQAITDNGYRWNDETKTLECLVEPKFKIGDNIRLLTRDNGVVYTVTRMTNTHYTVICDGKRVYEYRIAISKQDDYEKIRLKFDCNTLVPFESKVLIRNDKEQKWIPSFWGYKTDNGYITTFGWCRYCIPYKANEFLLGNNEDCDDYYKTWL
jgi:hypothetical protein